MMRIAEALDAFRPHRGDAIVVPGRGGRYWVEQTEQPRRSTCRSATRRWAAMPGSRSASRWPVPNASWCCSIPRATSR